MNLGAVIVLAGIACLLLELAVPGFFVACVGLALIATGIVAFFTDSAVLLLIVFAVLTTLIIVFLRPVMEKTSKKRERPSGVDALIGKSASVLEKVDGSVTGRVKIEGEDWKAAPASAGEAFEKGETVSVVRVEGVTVYVKSL